MKKYLSFFRVRFQAGLQYRAAAFGGIITQFFWGFLYLLLYNAFYRADPAGFPMSREAIASYVWLYQALLALYGSWMLESDLFQAVASGGIACELTRPLDLYTMWMVKSFASRIAKATLRFAPILVVAALLPDPYGLRLPATPEAFLLFLVSAALSLTVSIGFSMLLYGFSFYTVSPAGIRIFSCVVIDFCSGAVLPLPFLPAGLRTALELSPFGSMQNVCLRIYSGDIAGAEVFARMGLQVFWCVALILLGKLLYSRCVRRVVAQGG